MTTVVRMYVIRLESGYWRRGAGHTDGSVERNLKKATQYPTLTGAKTAASRLGLEDRFGRYEIVECGRVLGNVAFQAGNA